MSELIDKSISLPEKERVLAWIHEPTIFRLMHEFRWPKRVATQWFHDCMCWLYSAQRWQSMGKSVEFSMDGMHYLDDVWHAYILHTKDYIKMSNELFGIDYFHHQPGNPLIPQKLDAERLALQLEFLLEDWGEEYVERVWEFGGDLSDIEEKYAASKEA